MKKKIILFVILLSLFFIFLLPYTNPAIQNQLNDTSAAKNFTGTGAWSYLDYIKLPKNSVINSATLNLTGFLTYSTSVYNFSNTTALHTRGIRAITCRDATSFVPLSPPNALPPTCGAGDSSITTNNSGYDLLDTITVNVSVGSNLESYQYFEFNISEEISSITNLNISVYGEADDGGSGKYLYWFAYNVTKHYWYLLDSEYAEAGDFSTQLLSKSVTSASNFINTTGAGGNLIYTLFTEDEDNTLDLMVDYVEVKVTYLSSGFPSNITFQVNNSYVFNQTGEFSTQNKTTDFSGNITEFLAGCIADSEGYCYLPLNISGTGTIQISAININYTTPIPGINIVSPANLTNTTDTQIDVNYTLTNTSAGHSCWWTKNSGVTNTSISCGTNLTSQTWSEGLNTVTIYINNTDNQVNSSSITFRLDTTAPTVNIVYPTDYQSFNYQTGININSTISDSGVGLSSCWYRNNTDATNITFTCGTNFTISHAGDGNYIAYVWANDTLNNVGSDIVHYSISLTAPAITINYPTNGLWLSNGSNINFNVTATDDNGIKNCSLYGNWTGTWHLNQTNSSAITSGVEYQFIQNVSDGFYKFNFNCFDTTGVGSWGEINFTFGVDTTYPNINLTYPLNTTYTTLPSNLNFTRSDTNLGSCWYTTNGGVSNSTPNDCSNFTGLTSTQGSNTWKVYVNDSANNVNSSSVTFFVDSINPSVVINTSFSNGSYLNYNNSIKINLTISDTNLGSCWYNDNNSINISFTCGNNLTLNLSESFHTINIFANDTLNNVNNSERISFTTDLTYPVVNITSITTTAGLKVITFANTISDTNLGSCKYAIFDSLGNYEVENTTFICNIAHAAVVSGYGTYNLTIYAIDLAGNENSNTSAFTTTESTTPPGGGGGTTPEEEKPEKTFCGDNICQGPQTGFPNGNDYNQIENFWTCNKDCPQGFDFDQLFYMFWKNCWDDNPESICIWLQGFSIVEMGDITCGDGVCDTSENALTCSDCGSFNFNYVTTACMDNDDKTPCLYSSNFFWYIFFGLTGVVLILSLIQINTNEGKRSIGGYVVLKTKKRYKRWRRY